jgi:hypothetical protein
MLKQASIVKGNYWFLRRDSLLCNHDMCLASTGSTVRVWKDIVMSDARSIIGRVMLGFVKKEYEGIFSPVLTMKLYV